MSSSPYKAHSPLVLVQFILYLGKNKIGNSEEIRMPSIVERTFTAEQDHGRTDAPGRKVRFTNVEDTQEVVVAARFLQFKI